MLCVYIQIEAKQDIFIKQIIKYSILINSLAMLNKSNQNGLF